MVVHLCVLRRQERLSTGTARKGQRLATVS